MVRTCGNAASMRDPGWQTSAMRRTSATSRATLPLRRRTAIVALAVALNSGIYIAINTATTPSSRIAARSALDVALGWHAWTIWPYALLLLLAPLLALAIDERAIFVATLRAYVAALAMNVALWLAFPVRLPHVHLATDDGATAAAWRVLYALDGPSNCFPSGHVTLPLVIAAGFALCHPRRGWLAYAAIALLVPSVVTTGQHVAVDVAGGAATAFLGLLLARHPALHRRSRSAAR
jgi:membrane-associated phospholipid phosphatase